MEWKSKELEEEVKRPWFMEDPIFLQFDVLELEEYKAKLLAVSYSEVPNDCGGYYDREYRLYRIIYEGYPVLVYDEYFNAPWQIGGNSGQVRYAVGVTMEEALDLLQEGEVLSVYSPSGECIYEGSPDEGLLREVIKEALGGDV